MIFFFFTFFSSDFNLPNNFPDKSHTLTLTSSVGIARRVGKTGEIPTLNKFC